MGTLVARERAGLGPKHARVSAPSREIRYSYAYEITRFPYARHDMAIPDMTTPAEFGEFLARHVANWQNVIKQTGLQLD